MTDSHILCLGYGYTAGALARRLLLLGWQVSATFRDSTKAPANIRALPYPPPADDSITHILVSTPPSAGLPALPSYPNLRWLGYLSATSVYGDHGGAWVDETTPCIPTSPRGAERLAAEQSWQRAYPQTHVFRLAGIYGPDRNVLDELRAGTARRIDKPGQFFSRIHVEDIALVLAASIAKPNPGVIYNVADNEPASSAEVTAYGAQLLGLPTPPLEPYDPTRLSPMAASFYADNKRVRNVRIKTELGVQLLYPTYREGLRSYL